MHAMTAAHTTLPLPTWVEVTNLVNGKRVVVKVNDRGPFVDNRLIDLSFAAATELDMVAHRHGARRGSRRGAAAAMRPRAARPSRRSAARRCRRLPPRAVPAASIERMFVQIGAFAQPENAERLVARLARERLRESDRRQRARRPAHAAPRAAGADCATPSSSTS